MQELERKLESTVASGAALQVQLDTALAAQQQLAQQAEDERRLAAQQATDERRLAADKLRAAEAASAALQARVSELEARRVVSLSMTVQSHETEWRAEAVRAAALEARCTELQVQLTARQRTERLQAAW